MFYDPIGEETRPQSVLFSSLSDGMDGLQFPASGRRTQCKSFCVPRNAFAGSRSSVSTHPILAEVIESNLHHLNIRVTRRESVASEERSCRNNKRAAVQS